MNTSKLTFWAFSILLTLGSASAWSYDKGMAASGGEAIAHTAKVLETMTSAGYTYIRVDEEGGSFWIALPETQVGVGETISFYEQMLMEDFTSPSLKRTFDRILFVEAINIGAALPTKADTKPSPNKGTAVHYTEKQATVELASPIGRFTIKDIFEQRDGLGGKVVEIEGRVTKLSRQIMGTDWVHIEDGTGTKAEKNNKIILRTIQDGIAVGDEIVAKGVVYVNKDYGYGYFYPVIVEDAVFDK
ncbi:MAG: hypothetical protein AB2598_15635 [Candidatus Thiodiazotropha sp.]